MTYNGLKAEAADREVSQVHNKDSKGEMGLIALDRKGNLALEFNCDRMLRARKKGKHKTVAKIYRQAGTDFCCPGNIQLNI